MADSISGGPRRMERRACVNGSGEARKKTGRENSARSNVDQRCREGCRQARGAGCSEGVGIIRSRWWRVLVYTDGVRATWKRWRGRKEEGAETEVGGDGDGDRGHQAEQETEWKKKRWLCRHIMHFFPRRPTKLSHEPVRTSSFRVFLPPSRPPSPLLVDRPSNPWHPWMLCFSGDGAENWNVFLLGSLEFGMKVISNLAIDKSYDLGLMGNVINTSQWLSGFLEEFAI